jgi:hypothetical protein
LKTNSRLAQKQLETTVISHLLPLCKTNQFLQDVELDLNHAIDTKLDLNQEGDVDMVVEDSEGSLLVGAPEFVEGSSVRRHFVIAQLQDSNSV